VVPFLNPATVQVGDRKPFAKIVEIRSGEIVYERV
jgi:hypothetical protein